MLSDVPNTESIAASFDKYEVLQGLREVPLAHFHSAPRDLFYASDDLRATRELADQLRASRQIAPLIVVVNGDGPYVLEGAHRLGALHLLRAKSFPALVVRDTGRREPNPKVKLDFPSGEVRADAVLVGDNWAYHRMVTRYPPEDPKPGKRWSVTHVPTGLLAMSNIEHKSVARRAAELANEVAPHAVDPDEAGAALQAIGWREMIKRVEVARYNTAANNIAIIEEFAAEAKKKRRPKKAAERKPARARRPKKAAKRKPARTQKPAAPREFDLIALARKARGNPPDADILERKSRMLSYY